MINASIFGAVIKLMQSGLNFLPETFSKAFVFFKSTLAMGISLSPALISVGFIIGKRVSLMVFSGGAFAWLIVLPLISMNVNYDPSNDLMGHAYDIWNTKIRYVGVGAMLVGGVWSLLSVFSFIINGIKENSQKKIPSNKKDIPTKWVIISMIAISFILTFLYNQEVNSIILSVMLSILMIFLAFIFSAVAAYRAGVVGSSNNPVSGVTIATIMISSLVILGLTSPDNAYGPLLAILIGSVV